MPREPDPINDEQLFNSIELGGIRSPGTVTLSGHDRDEDWDVQVGAGTTGASTTLKAEKPAEFTASFYLADEDDFAAWPAFRDLIFSSVTHKPTVTIVGRPATKASALDIYHPDLVTNGIKSVVLKTMGGVVHDHKGGQTIAVKFLEYKPAKPKTVTPLGSNAKTANDPDAKAKAELAALTNQYQNTPWG